MFYRWLQQHAPHPAKKNQIMRCRSNAEMAAMINQFADVPTQITHRINAKGYSVINRKKFDQCSEVVINDAASN
jgi:hypothetical protein